MTTANVGIMKRIAAVDLVEGDIVYIDGSDEFDKVSSAEATNAFGVVYADADAGQACSVIKQGLATVRILVEDTDGASGYDTSVTVGGHLIVSGKSGGTYDTGQALSQIGGTGVSTADATTIVAKALEAVSGTTSGDTYTTIKAYVNFV